MIDDLTRDMAKAIERDPWAHVEPSIVRVHRRHRPIRDASGRVLFHVLDGTSWEHPTVNGGTHCVWEWPDGEAWEYWKDADGDVVAGPRLIERVKDAG